MNYSHPLLDDSCHPILDGVIYPKDSTNPFFNYFSTMQVWYKVTITILHYLHPVCFAYLYCVVQGTFSHETKFSFVLIKGIATQTSHMSTPVKPVHQKECSGS